MCSWSGYVHVHIVILVLVDTDMLEILSNYLATWLHAQGLRNSINKDLRDEQMYIEVHM